MNIPAVRRPCQRAARCCAPYAAAVGVSVWFAAVGGPARADEPPPEDASLRFLLLEEREHTVNGAKQKSCVVQFQSNEFNADMMSEWVLGKRSPIRPPAQDQQSSNDGLEQQMAALSRRIRLTKDQRTRLELAGRVDFARFWEDYDALSREFAACPKRAADLTPLIERGDALQQRYRTGLYGKGSLFDKTLSGVLSAEQQAAMPRPAASEPAPGELQRSSIRLFQEKDGRLRAVNWKPLS